jgi:rod shape-determining protein MreB
MGFLGNLYRDIAIDIGTSNTLIYIRGEGIVLNEPSIIARERESGKVVAIGEEAMIMHEKIHPGIVTVRPLANGVIADYDATQELIKGLIQKSKSHYSFGINNMVISVPSGITAVEKRSVRDFAHHVGAKKVYLLTSPMAAAIGIGLDIKEAMGNMIVEIGSGTTEIAIISLNGIVSGECLRVAGNDMTNLIIRHFNKSYNLAISDTTAEEVKIKLGSAYKLDKELSMIVRGVNLASGLPESRDVDSATIREVIATPITQIITAIKKSLEVLVIKPDISVDILDRGIYLSGGSALLKGLDKKINIDTNLGVHVCEEPMTVVAKGMGEVLENIDKYRDIYTT